LGAFEAMCLACKNKTLTVCCKIAVFIFAAASVLRAEWSLTASDTSYVFTLSIPIAHNAEHVIEYLWSPAVLARLSRRISNVKVISSQTDSQTIEYSFSFLGYSSRALYLRYKSLPECITVKQLSFSTNSTIWPVPLSSQAIYTVDLMLPQSALHYSQIVVFSKTLKPWDVLYVRILISMVVSDFHNILKDFSDK
jgi:hypothetical protein